MAELQKLKNRRSTCRTKTTNSIKAAMKFTSEDIAAIKPKELAAKIELVKIAMEKHEEAQQAVLEMMVAEGKAEVEIQGEVEGNEAVEKVYDQKLEELEECLTLSSLYLNDQRVQRGASTWLKESTIEAPAFREDGNKRREELEALISELTPYAAHPYIGGQLKKAQTMSEELCVKLFKASATPKEVEAAPAAKKVSRSVPPPYQVKPPTFSGKPKEYQHFIERFQAIMDLHDDYYPEADKLSILADAMLDPEAKKLVVSNFSSGYNEVMKQLQENYGRKTVIYPQLVEELVRRERYDYSRESMRLIMDRTKRLLNDMEKVGGRCIDMLTVALVVRDFDPELINEWTKHLGSEDKLPTLDQLLEFITPLSHNLPRKSRNSNSHSSSSKFFSKSSTATSMSGAAVTSTSQPTTDKKQQSETPNPKTQCQVCKSGNHPMYRCATFKDSTVAQRWKLIKQHKLCSNCLHHSHTVEECTSAYVCRFCKEKHNYLLHKEESKKSTTPTGTVLTSAAEGEIKNNKVANTAELGCGFIHTALVSVQHQGRRLTARAALDNCATHSILSDKVASFLQPQRQPVDLTMRGAVSEKKLKHWSTVTISTVVPSDIEVPIGVAIAPELPPATPPNNATEVAKNSLLKGLTLADPEFGGKLDLIIGTNDLPLFWQEGERKFSMIDRLTAVNTIFGWTVSGPVETAKKTGTTLKVELQTETDSELFQRMYELETVPAPNPLTKEEQSAVSQFEKSVRQEEDGRYSCVLPKVENPPPLGSSSKMAKSRLINNERRMHKLGKLKEFNAEMYGYVELQHAVEMSEVEDAKYYLPVKGVIKEDSTTTKVRPVFDASARTSTGYSLNDTLLVGPNLYPLIQDILLQFRGHRIAMTADISKMYREVRLAPEDQQYHCLYIRAPDGSLLTCKMKRLTFGVRPSPFVATSVLRHHADKHKQEFPVASREVKTHFYVDDLLSGADDLDEAVEMREELCKLLSLCGMKLRKWRSNSQRLLNTIPEDLIEKEERQQLVKGQPLKTLGIHWDTANDTFLVTTPTLDEQGAVNTKRGVARVVAGVFDVLGLVSPYLISGKIFLQNLWLHKVKWDDAIPQEMLPKWQCWVDEMPVIRNHQITRFTGSQLVTTDKHLHGFADASTEAFGAVIYLKCLHNEQTTSIQLICSKARVRPLKPRSIPEMELEAAKLLSKLIVHVACALSIPLSKVYTWSDSTTVLSWLRQSPHKFKTFVCNRVAEIQELLPNTQWGHVPSLENPADLCSRGMTAQALVESKLWWEGPHWLVQPPENWPKLPENDLEEKKNYLPGLRATVLVAMTTKENVLDWWVWQKYSCYTKLTRIIAWVRRFIAGCRHRNTQPPERSLTWKDISDAKNLLLIVQQKWSFPDAFVAVAKKKQLVRGHSLVGMGLELSSDHAYLSVRGRVNERSLIPLSAQCKLTKLMLRTEHKRQSHPGVSTMISILGDKFYIVGLKRQLKLINRQCPQCQRANAVPLQQQMGILPAARITLKPPFYNTGIDFAGPVTVREGATRKPVLFKGYWCLFVCMSTRAIHIEVCRSLEKDEFVAALKRFCNRRGTPKEIFSDNGTNFIGAHNEMKEVQKMIENAKQDISVMETEMEMKWNFNPPRAPHFGGLWEAGVKIMKRQIRKIVAPHPLRLDELINVSSEVEAILNSRPLVAAEGVEPEMGLALTPAHFLIYRPMKAPPTPAASQARVSTLRRWQLVQRLSQDLEKDWKGHYLQSLQARSKWNHPHRNAEVGDLVFVKDEVLSNGKRWPLGKITQVYPGRDKLVRTVDVLCGGKTYRRAIHRLIPLQLEEDEQEEK